jgi:hypothetical protein
MKQSVFQATREHSCCPCSSRADVRRARTFRLRRHKTRSQIVSVGGRQTRSLRAGIGRGWLRVRARQRGRQEQLQKRRPLPCSHRVPLHFAVASHEQKAPDGLSIGSVARQHDLERNEARTYFNSNTLAGAKLADARSCCRPPRFDCYSAVLGTRLEQYQWVDPDLFSPSARDGFCRPLWIPGTPPGLSGDGPSLSKPGGGDDHARRFIGRRRPEAGQRQKLADAP